jgi:hypothetical protein
LFFWIPIELHSLPIKLYALTHPPSLLANWGRLWTFDLDKSWVRGRYGHFVHACLLRWSKYLLTSFWSKEVALSRFSVSCVSVFGTAESLIPTIWGLGPGFYILFRKRDPWPFPGEMHPAAWLRQPWDSVDGDNFLDLQMNSDSRISWRCR